VKEIVTYIERFTKSGLDKAHKDCKSHKIFSHDFSIDILFNNQEDNQNNFSNFNTLFNNVCSSSSSSDSDEYIFNQ